MDMNIHKVSKIEISKNRDMHKSNKNCSTSAYVRTITITSHGYGDVDNEQKFEICLFGSKDVKHIEEALQIKL